MQAAGLEELKQRPGAQLFRLAPSELRLGQRVVLLDRAWTESPFPGPSLILESFEQKKLLEECCAWLIIDLSASLNRTRPEGPQVEPLQERLPNLPERIELLQTSRLTSHSMRVGLRIYNILVRRITEFMLSFRISGELDIGLAQSVVSLLVHSQNLSLAALIWLTRIKERRFYLAQHSINTSILMAGFAHALGWSRTQVETAAMVGLLHDVGKARLDLNILGKPGELTLAELNEMRSHPVIGHDLLKDSPGLSWEALAAIRASHERPDGQGYPLGLSGEEVPVMARLIAIVDAYDAMTSERPHRPPMTHQQALGVLWKQRAGQFDQALVESFIQFLGWIPPGTLVRLSDRRLAVLIEMQKRGSTQALVRIIKGLPDAFELGDEILLAPQFGAAAGAPLRIAELLPDNADGYSMRLLTAKLFDQLDVPLEASELEDRLAAAQESVAPPAAEEFTEAPPPAAQPSSEPARPGSATATEPPRGPYGGLDCLVVDDSLTIRKALEAVLIDKGFRVRCVETGEEAIRQVEQQPADVIFLDILLPGMSGFSVLRAFRRARLLGEMPVIMISGNPQATEHYFLERIGADDFIPKPFGRDDVDGCLERLRQRGRLQPAAAVHD